MTKFTDAQSWEKSWWSNCINTFNEEQKQLIYAKKMGLRFIPDDKTPYIIDMHGKKVLDIGGGPTSLLLKCLNVKGKVIDPIKFPDWVYERYKIAKIRYEIKKAENLDEKEVYDEIWIYNCLQHTENPAKIVANIKKITKIIRLFEWIDTPPNIGHPNTLTKEKLNSWLGGEGKTELLKGENGCKGHCYYGIFIGEKYEKI